jgi:ERCC4-related helicase
MESSINSFAITVENILYKIDKTLEAIEQSQLDYDAEMDINDIDIDDPEYDNLMFGNNVKVLLQDMDLIKWQQDLLADKDKLETILLEAINVTPDRDAKLIELRTLIENKIKSPINPKNRKVIVFTAFADTARYLYENLADDFAKRGIYSAIVTGSGDNHSTLPIPKELRRSVKMTDINTVLTLFSPISKECSKVYPEVNEYIDILIATDCISEGQNLQDCDYLINYDTR